MTFPEPVLSFARRTALPLCWVLTLLFAAWVGAQLFWRLTAPEPVAALPRHETDPRKAAVAIAGTSGPRESRVAVAAPPAAWNVVGLATGLGSLPGFALLRASDGRVLTVRVGDALPDGRRVDGIAAEGVLVADERLPAPRRSPAAATDAD